MPIEARACCRPYSKPPLRYEVHSLVFALPFVYVIEIERPGCTSRAYQAVAGPDRQDAFSAAMAPPLLSALYFFSLKCIASNNITHTNATQV